MRLPAGGTNARTLETTTTTEILVQLCDGIDRQAAISECSRSQRQRVRFDTGRSFPRFVAPLRSPEPIISPMSSGIGCAPVPVVEEAKLPNPKLAGCNVVNAEG
jgi:hypothetical protein